MKQIVLLTQLYKVPAPEYIMGTCHVADNEDDERFECKIEGDKQYKEQLWQYVTGQWKGMTCEIEFNDVTEKGIPIDAVITQIKAEKAPHFRSVTF